MPDRECGDNANDVEKADANSSTTAPTRSRCEQRRRQQKHEKKQEMVCAFRNVVHSQAERSGETAEAGHPVTLGDTLRRSGFGLRELQLIRGLVFVAALRGDLNVSIARDESVHEIDRHRRLVVILKNQMVPGGAGRQFRREIDVYL